jgi:hypothetical protein
MEFVPRRMYSSAAIAILHSKATFGIETRRACLQAYTCRRNFITFSTGRFDGVH